MSESKQITMAQLDEHKSHDDLWLLVDGKGKSNKVQLAILNPLPLNLFLRWSSDSRNWQFQFPFFLAGLSLRRFQVHGWGQFLSHFLLISFHSECSSPFSFSLHHSLSFFRNPLCLNLSSLYQNRTVSTHSAFPIWQHPGGDEVLLSEGGKDATEAFEDVGHSDDARALLPKMLVGSIEGGVSILKEVDSIAFGCESGSGREDWALRGRKDWKRGKVKSVDLLLN